MAPRKAGKHSETEVAERAVEAGDVSPPKRKKTVAKTVNKADEERQIRLPRAAKAVKTEQIEISQTIANATKKAKTKSKTVASKTTSVPAKANSKVKSVTKKSKNVDEKLDENSLDTEDVKNSEETQTKKTRSKAATKKAGTDVNEERVFATFCILSKAKGRAKKNTVAENTENSEAPTTKRRRNVNNETAVKETKPKGRATKKKPDEVVEVKNKVSNAKKKAPASNSNEINDNQTQDSTTTQKGKKKANNEKPVKAIVRKTRGKKTETAPETASEIEEESKVEGESSSESPPNGENDHTEILDEDPDTTESEAVKRELITTVDEEEN